jgi:hypothetical protein
VSDEVLIVLVVLVVDVVTEEALPSYSVSLNIIPDGCGHDGDEANRCPGRP